MQTTDDGEYIPQQELDTNFKIPKKKRSLQEASSTLQDQVLETSHYNNESQTSHLMPPGGPIRIDAAQSLILQNLQMREYEKPKTYANHILQDTIPDYYDDSLPRELTSLFQPLYCKLCSSQLSSNVVAKLHYKSKNHEKKIRKFLFDFSEKTGEPLHKRAKLTGKSKGDDECDSNPMYFYCDVCDLTLTGKLHAESHYMGRNHRKAILGVKKPAGKGHFDATGKWIREGSSQKRTSSNTNYSEDDSFGTCFRAPVEAPPLPTFRCEVCNITTTCLEQLESHYSGQKHRKKIKQQTTNTIKVIAKILPHAPKLNQDNILTSVLLADTSKGDTSAYRTPSGSFYCQVCNITSNSEVQFKQHLHSKTHLRRAIKK